MITNCKQCFNVRCSVDCKSVISYLNREIYKLNAIINKLKFVKSDAVRMIECNDSSLVKAFGYDIKKAELYLTFTGGTEYVYFNVHNSLFTNMINAESRGKFYNDNIKGKFDVIRLDV